MLSSFVSTLATLCRLLVTAEVRHFRGGLVPQELINLVIEQSCPVRDKGSSYQNKILGPEVNLPFNPLAEGLDLISLSVLLWTCKV